VTVRTGLHGASGCRLAGLTLVHGAVLLIGLLALATASTATFLVADHDTPEDSKATAFSWLSLVPNADAAGGAVAGGRKRRVHRRGTRPPPSSRPPGPAHSLGHVATSGRIDRTADRRRLPRIGQS
jgi:hypothetical protein